MKKFAKISKLFIEKLNVMINISNKKISDRSFYNNLLDNIKETKRLFNYDESLIFNSIKKEESPISTNKKEFNLDNLIFLISNKFILAILSKNTRNLSIKQDIFNIQEDHYKSIDNTKMVSFNLQKYKNTVYIDNEEDLLKIVDSLDNFILDVYDHSYRTYIPFVCFISLYNSDGFIYIINYINLINKINELGILTCKYKKILSINSYMKLKINSCCCKLIDIQYEDMKFNNYKISNNTEIDWRIPNIELYLKEYIENRLIYIFNIIDNKIIDNNIIDNKIIDNKIIDNNIIDNKIIDNKIIDKSKWYEKRFLYIHKDSDNYFNLFKKYLINKYSIKDNKYLLKLLKNRENISKINNESIYYVMTNKQLVMFYKNKFKNEKEIINNEIILSSILKQNINLFFYN